MQATIDTMLVNEKNYQHIFIFSILTMRHKTNAFEMSIVKKTVPHDPLKFPYRAPPPCSNIQKNLIQTFLLQCPDA